MEIIENTLQTIVLEAKLIVRGEILDIKNNNASMRLKEAFKILIDKVYFNLSILRNQKYKEEDIKKYYLNAKDGFPTTEAQQTIFDYINSQKRNSLRVTVKGILDRFNKKNYGWSNFAVLSNIAGLIGTKKIELIYDSNLLLEDEFINYLKNSNLRSNIIVQIKEEIPQEKVEKLKKFYKDFFEKPPNALRTFELADEIKQAINSLNIKLQNYIQQIQDFPFLETYKEKFNLIKEISQKNNSWIIDDLPNEKKLVDLKINFLDPIITFFEGPQSSIYKDAYIFYENNFDNIMFLKNTKSDEIKAILNDSECFLGNKIPNLKRCKTELEKEITSKKLEEVNFATNKFNQIKKQIESLSDYVNADKEDQSRIISEIENNIYTLNNTNNILSIPAIFDNFEKNKLPSLISSLVKNDDQKIISSSSIKLNNRKLILESEEDVNDYIENYKRAILNEIRSGNKIKI